jgi:predicted dehydrogenase
MRKEIIMSKMSNSSTTRRSFLKNTSLGVAGAAAMTMAHSTRAAAKDEKIIIGSIGCGGRGTFLAQSFAGHKDVEVAYVCDVDDSHAASAAKGVAGRQGKEPKIVRDLRKVLDDPAVQAVTIGTPDHWHGPAALLALEAGKHVYVEKPCSHNIREGRLMVELARRKGLVVQTGTQSRSGEHVKQAMQMLREGEIGDVLVAKAWNSQRRGNIGKGAPSEPPKGLDYDLWLGPIPQMPYQSNRLHYSWHWWYATGTGDMGNDGVHDLDLARFGLGVDTHPTSVAAIGGKYFFDDDQQFPDTQMVIFEYGPVGGVDHKSVGGVSDADRKFKLGQRKQLIFEQRIWSPYRQEGYENGNAFYGTKGMLLLGKGDGWKLYGERNKLRKEMGASERETPHQRDFLNCIKNGGKPAADIEIGHLSATLCHLGNLACRVGRQLKFDPKQEQILGDDDANRLVRREYREGHFAVPKGV